MTEADTVKTRLSPLRVLLGLDKKDFIIGGNGAEILRGGEYTDGQIQVFLKFGKYFPITERYEGLLSRDGFIQWSAYVTIHGVLNVPEYDIIDGFKVAR